jgi:hypothetical protein
VPPNLAIVAWCTRNDLAISRQLAPLYRGRVARRAAELDKLDDQYHVAQLFHHVFGTHEGGKALDYICQVLCGIDDPIVTLVDKRPTT